MFTKYTKYTKFTKYTKYNAKLKRMQGWYDIAVVLKLCKAHRRRGGLGGCTLLVVGALLLWWIPNWSSSQDMYIA